MCLILIPIPPGEQSFHFGPCFVTVFAFTAPDKNMCIISTPTQLRATTIIYRCIALLQLLYRWHQSRKLWIPPCVTPPLYPKKTKTMSHGNVIVRALVWSYPVVKTVLYRSRPGIAQSLWQRAGRPGFDSGHGRFFFSPPLPDSALRLTQPPMQLVSGTVSVGIKRPGLQVHHSPPSNDDGSMPLSHIRLHGIK
jgi:hypothetical protein